MASTRETYLEQYYCFKYQGVVWVEMFFDTTHVTAPGPCSEVSEQIALLERLHPGTTVDELLPEDIADAMSYAM